MHFGVLQQLATARVIYTVRLYYKGRHTLQLHKKTKWTFIKCVKMYAGKTKGSARIRTRDLLHPKQESCP
jgi:hypothetical protein